VRQAVAYLWARLNVPLDFLTSIAAALARSPDTTEALDRALW
jgi:hypothetical protein